MKTKFVLFIFCLGFLTSTSAQQRKWYGTIEQTNSAKIVYCNDHIYMFGEKFGGNAKFNVTGSEVLYNLNGLFLAKYNTDGSVDWVKKIGDVTNLGDYKIKVSNQGDIYVYLNFTNDATINSVKYTETGGYYENKLLMKLSEEGEIIWVKSIKSKDYMYRVQDMNIDRNGNVYLIGNYFSEIIFDENTALVSHEYYLNTPQMEAYVAKYDKNGNVLWARAYPAKDDGFSDGYGIACDPNSDNILITGWFTGVFDYATNLQSEGERDMFFAKCDVNGNILWIKTAGGTNWDTGIAVAFDNQGNCIVAGCFDYFSGPVIIEGEELNADIRYSNIFIAKYDSNGTFKWVRTGGGDAYFTDEPAEIVVDEYNDIYLGGYFGGIGSFGKFKVRVEDSGSYTRMFLVKYNVDGQEIWAETGMATVFRSVNSIAMDKENREIYVAGKYMSGPSGGYPFIQKYYDNSESSSTGIYDCEFSTYNIYPNPTTDVIFLDAESHIKVYDLQGILLQEIINNKVDLSAYPQGLYLLQVGNVWTKVMKK